MSHRLVAGLLVVLLGYLVLAPLWHLQSLALADGGAAYGRVMGSPHFWASVRMTVWLTLGSLVIAVVLGTLLAWFATRLPRRWEWMSILPFLPIVLPPVAMIVGWTMLLQPKSGIINRLLRSLYESNPARGVGPVDIFSPTWIIILTGISLTSYIYIFLRNGLSRFNSELVEAARVSGAHPARVFFGIVLPALRPSYIYGVSVALLMGLGQFTAPLLLGTAQNVRVVTTEVYRYTSNAPVDYGAAAAAASPLLVVGVLLLLFQRYMLADQARFVADTGKGSRHAGRSSPVAIYLLSGYFLIATVLPILALLVVSLAPFWSGVIQPARWTLENYATVLAQPSTLNSIRTSLVVSVAAMAVVLPIGYLVAELLYRRRRAPTFAAILDFLVSLPLGVPAVVFGAGFLFTYTRPPFVLYGTYWVIVIVYVTLMLPFAVRMQLAARLAMGPSYEEAARLSGASALRAHVGVLVPMMRSAIAGAGAVIFVLLSHEFAASLLVRSTQTQVMGTTFYDYWINTSYPVVAAMGLIMCLLTATGVALAFALGGKGNTLERL